MSDAPPMRRVIHQRAIAAPARADCHSTPTSTGSNAIITIHGAGPSAATQMPTAGTATHRARRLDSHAMCLPNSAPETGSASQAGPGGVCICRIRRTAAVPPVRIASNAHSPPTAASAVAGPPCRRREASGARTCQNTNAVSSRPITSSSTRSRKSNCARRQRTSRRRRYRNAGASASLEGRMRTDDCTRAAAPRHGSFAPAGALVAPSAIMSPRAAVVYSPEYQCDIGPHVFPMEKFQRVRRALIESGDVQEDQILVPQPASRADLLLVHTAEYLDDLDHLRWTPRTACSELPLTAEIVHAYVLAAGGTTLAAREALGRGAGWHAGGGFHHAFADMASGFCYI